MIIATTTKATQPLRPKNYNLIISHIYFPQAIDDYLHQIKQQFYNNIMSNHSDFSIWSHKNHKRLLNTYNVCDKINR